MRIDDWKTIAAQKITACERDMKGSADESFTYAGDEGESLPHLAFYFREGPVDPSEGFQDRLVNAGLQLVVNYDPSPGINTHRDGERLLVLFEDAHTWVADGTCFAVQLGSWIPAPSRTRLNGIECTLDIRVAYALTGV